MKINLTYRLIAAILSATGIAILFLFLVMQWSISQGFYRYLDKFGQAKLGQLADNLGRMYAERQSWEFLKITIPLLGLGDVTPPELEAGRQPFGEPDMNGHGRRPPNTLPYEAIHQPLVEPGMNEYGQRPPPFNARQTGGPIIILNAAKEPILGSYSAEEKVNFQPIIANGEIVGYVGLLSPKNFLHPMQMQFLSQQKLVLALSAAGMVLVAILISLPLARRVIKPIRAMARATQDISSGKYATRIHSDSSDELGQLARDFNNRALTLEKHEKDRRQWVADISHELRTPVAVLQIDIEALLDGIRTITPEAIRSLHAETLRLKRLVEDLYQLSLSDIGALTYRKENIDLLEALRHSMESYHAEFVRKGIALTSNISEEAEVAVFADRERLNQLFANLFENSLRYTDAGGELAINLNLGQQQAILEFQDSAPGVPEKELDRLFERLYRVEGSRSRTSGGAGLGLAICKNIVVAHEGTISAYQSSLGGLLIRMTFPVSGGSA
jgi:two-component system sensor histidine kinase BaeS